MPEIFVTGKVRLGFFKGDEGIPNHCIVKITSVHSVFEHSTHTVGWMIRVRFFPK